MVTRTKFKPKTKTKSSKKVTVGKKTSVHDKPYDKFLREDVLYQGFKGMGKYFKRKFTSKVDTKKRRKKVKRGK